MGVFAGFGETWGDVFAGLVIVAAAVMLVKMLYSWYIFRKSIQKELYSNFIEYFFKRKSIKKLSKSAYFNSEFGSHRIIYQLVQDKEKEKPLAYVMVALSSGIYALNVKSEKGEVQVKDMGDFRNIFTDKKAKKEIIVNVHNPVNEIKRFERAIDNKLNINCPVYEYVVYPDKTKITREGEMLSNEETLAFVGNTGIINRNTLFEAISSIHTKSEAKLSDQQIDKVYSMMTAEVMS